MIDEALAVEPFVDAILLDSGNPSLAIKELGGTGRTHDWAVSARIRESLAVPLFLAGGLTPENVGEAIRTAGIPRDEIVVTTFTAGAGVMTLPQWILGAIARPNNVPQVNVMATFVMLVSIPVAWLAQKLSDS